MLEAIQRLLSMPMRHSNNDVVYIPTGQKKKQIGMLKPQDFLGKMNPNYTNIYALSILVR